MKEVFLRILCETFGKSQCCEFSEFGVQHIQIIFCLQTYTEAEIVHKIWVLRRDIDGKKTQCYDLKDTVLVCLCVNRLVCAGGPKF